jgi:hypothetical protein
VDRFGELWVRFGSRAIGRVSLFIISCVAVEIGRCILLKRICYFECRVRVKDGLPLCRRVVW